MSNTEAAQVSVPVTNSGQVVTTQGDVWRRAGRTAIQIIAAGGLTAVTDQLANDLPTAYVPYMVAIYTLIVSLAQNAAEGAGYLPAILKRPSITQP